MSDNRTTELLQKIQNLLDGRGAEYTVQDALIGWLLTVEHPTETWTYKICVHTTGLIDIWGSHITPEQAIAATLGDDDYEHRMDELLCRLTNGKWSKSRSYTVDFMVACVDEAYEEVCAEDAETLGGGKLTAEQVSKATYAHSIHADCADADWQAIADELNAALGGGECKVVASSTDGLTTDNPKQWFELSCGHTFKIYGLDVPVACPVCGKAVKR